MRCDAVLLVMMLNKRRVRYFPLYPTARVFLSPKSISCTVDC